MADESKKRNEMLERLKSVPSHQDFNVKKDVADSLSGVTKKISEKGGAVSKQMFDPEALKRLRSTFGTALSKPRKPSLGGLAAGAIGLGSSLLPEESMAATAAQTVGRVAEEGDPTSLLMPGYVGEGSDQVTPEMQQEMQADQERRKAQIQALRSLPQQDYVTPRQTLIMTGEQPVSEQTEAGPIQSSPETGRFSRLFKDKGTYR